MKRISYRLRQGVRLECRGEGVYLLSAFPLVAVRVNQVFYEILSEMKRSDSLSCLGERDRELVRLLDRLVSKGMLEKDETADLFDYPVVSVIVPVKNRARDIEDCLRSLSSLDYPGDRTEIIVVDDGSEDATSQVVQRFGIRAIRLDRSIGASGCRNLAVREARGEMVGFTDSDCVVHPRWLKDLVPFFEETDVGIVGGYVSNFSRVSRLDRYEDVKSSLNMGQRPFESNRGKLSRSYVPSCNLIVRKRAFLQAGGFQENLKVGEDVDLCWRIQELGYRLRYLPRGEVKHKHRNRLYPMLARRFDYGTSEAILSLRHKDRRKKIYLPVLYSFFYGSFSLGIILRSIPFFAIGCGIWLVDFSRKYLEMRTSRLGLPVHQMCLPVLRSYFSFVYNLSAYLVRYYLLFMVPLAFFYPPLWIFLFFLLFFSASVDFSIHRPRINFIFHVLFYTLDQLSYQAGVFWGCLSRKNFASYFPRIIQKASPDF